MGRRDPNDVQPVKKIIKKQPCSKTHSQKVGVLDIGSNSIRLVIYKDKINNLINYTSLFMDKTRRELDYLEEVYNRFLDLANNTR